MDDRKKEKKGRKKEKGKGEKKMAVTMIGTVTLREFQAKPLGTSGKGLQVEGLVAMQIPFSAATQTMPFKVTEFAEKQAEFMRKYFFSEQGKQALAKGNLSNQWQ